LKNTLIKKIKEIDITKITIVIFLLTISILTRFYPPVSPTNGMVFDESYFVPQVESYAVGKYFFDPHPHLARMFMYYGMKMFNPSATSLIDPSKLANKVDNYKTPLNMDGIRFFPRVFGSLVPIMLFLVAFEFINWKRRKDPNYFFPLLVSLLGVFENIFIVESRYALITQFLLFFMLLPIYFSIKYYKSALNHFSLSKFKTSKILYTIKYLLNESNIYLLITGLALGTAVSTKWFALSVLPFILILISVRQARQDSKYLDLVSERLLKRGSVLPSTGVAVEILKRKMKAWRDSSRIVFAKYILSVTAKVLVVIALAFIVYSGVFAWHFSKITTFADSAEEIRDYCPDYYNDLKNGTHNATFLCKLYSQYELSNKYERYVPELDFTKKDEIGSKWLTWPIMSRTISYYWQTDNSEEYSFVYLMGNPINWAFGIIGIVLLFSKIIVDFFEGRRINIVHALLIMLFFANWLPYAFISRVMYLYHYIPALMFSFIIFGVALKDVVMQAVDRVLNQRVFTETKGQQREEFEKKVEGSMKKENKVISAMKNLASKLDTSGNPAIIIKGVIFALIVLASLVSYFYYYPLTYLYPLSKEQFEARYLVKDWDMKWPGK